MYNVGVYKYEDGLRLQDTNKTLLAIGSYLTNIEVTRVKKYLYNWDFYEGYHWQNIEHSDKPEVTKNYCRTFVDKFVAFEFSKGFMINVPSEDELHMQDKETPKVVSSFLNSVWDDHNNRLKLCTELGQTKSVTGKSWIQVKYDAVGSFPDPFHEFPLGKIRLLNMSPTSVFPVYDVHDKDKLVSLSVMYAIEEEEETLILRRRKLKTRVYKVVWTDTHVLTTIDGKPIVPNGVTPDENGAVPNPYGIIPFVEIVNYPLANRTEGISDLEDIIPLNVELNLKNSDISEIIDYHASPVTIVYGADIGSLSRGANKMWGGIPTEAKIENLNMDTDLSASLAYTADIKKSLHEVGNVPANALGDISAISNTSGVALQILNMPLIERTRVKRLSTCVGIQHINKLILLIGLVNGMVEKPESMSWVEFYKSNAVFQDPLPKDTLIELQQLEAELKIGVESRQGAMLRLGKDIKKTTEEINKDYEEHREFYGHEPKMNSGELNGQTPNEVNNIEENGANVNSAKVR